MTKFETLLREILDSDLVLLDVRHDSLTDHWVIIVDSETEVSLDRTTKLAKKVINHPEVEAKFPDGIQIEVSSPGIDYPLTQLFQFKKNIGRELRMELDPKWDRIPKKLKLNKIEENILQLSHSNKAFQIPFQDVRQAHVLIKFR